MRARTIVALTLSLLLTGLAPADATSRRPSAKRAEPVTVTGTLTDEGVECRALRADNGTLYTLTGDLKTFKTGDHVTVTGTTEEVSTCMQGTTIAVTKIEAATPTSRTTAPHT